MDTYNLFTALEWKTFILINYLLPLNDNRKLVGHTYALYKQTKVWHKNRILSCHYFLFVGDYPLAGLHNHATCCRWKSGRMSTDVCIYYIDGQYRTVLWQVNAILFCYSLTVHALYLCSFVTQLFPLVFYYQSSIHSFSLSILHNIICVNIKNSMYFWRSNQDINPKPYWIS